MVEFTPKNGIIMFIKRNITQKLEKSIGRSPVILLTGPRQTGKTTLIKHIATLKKYTYITFDDLRFLSAAKNNPIGFIEDIQKPIILDEIQRVPELFLPIKHDVDNNRIPGRYILTGSANPLLIPRLGDSLAGRMEILQLFPLSQGELIGKHELFIDWIFDKDKTFNLHFEKLSKQALYQKIIQGGFPLVQATSDENREDWFNSYITTILERDVQDLAHITGLSELPHLLQLLAARSGTLLNSAELGRSAGIASSTLHRYVTLLEALFLVIFQPAWHANLSKRLLKSPKTYLIDTGLLAFLIDLRLEKITPDYRFIGNVVENFVFTELKKQLTWSPIRLKSFHFRTLAGIEVDIVLEDRGGNIVGIEVKNSDTVLAHDFKGLKYLQEEIGDSFIKGIILYNGSEIIPFGGNFYAMPMSTLWGTKN